MIGEEYNELIIAIKQWFSKSSVNIIFTSEDRIVRESRSCGKARMFQGKSLTSFF